jgi:glycosyltransferase involved in cell wall biosynthesis
VYNAVEFTGNAAERPKDEPFDLVTVCRLVPWKGVRELIDLSIENGWRLKIVGDGPLRPDLEEHVAAHRATEVICFRGSVPRTEVSNEIGTAKLFVLNSSYEGLPHIVLEAKAAGVPVIATAVGGTPETITHGVDGFLIPVGNPDTLVATVRYLLDRPDERNRIGRAGRRQIESQFSFERMVSETDQIFQAVCSRRAEPTGVVEWS